jgi:hypothetical protein
MRTLAILIFLFLLLLIPTKAMSQFKAETVSFGYLQVEGKPCGRTTAAPAMNRYSSSAGASSTPDGPDHPWSFSWRLNPAADRCGDAKTNSNASVSSDGHNKKHAMSEKLFGVTKTVAESYGIARNDASGSWANITIDTAGRLSIQSDYGNWQYYWGAHGGSFKSFLTGLNKQYVADKFGASNCFDIDSTIETLEAVFEEAEKEGEMTPEMVDESETEIKSLRQCSTMEHYCHVWVSCEIAQAFQDNPDVSYRISPLFERFWDEVWPVFIEELKKELKDGQR